MNTKTYASDNDLAGPPIAASDLEIEITPAMIAAGVSAFLGYDSRFENEACAVEDIYRAMVMAKVYSKV